jgi:hypothetical protein
MDNLTLNKQQQTLALNSTESTDTLSLPGVVGFVAAFAAICLLSCLPVHLICRYISSKPVGMQRLADLIYSDVARYLLKMGLQQIGQLKITRRIT